MPWNDGIASEIPLRATALRDIGQLGRRDRLSLLAQFAAHEALLRFAGVPDGEVDPAEWAVVQKRGSDCRLVRVAARTVPVAEAPPPLSLAQQFAEIVAAPPLEALRQSWARAEAIYVESFRRLREDAATDLQWTRRSAVGRILSPGVEALRDIAARGEPRFTYGEPAIVEALSALGVLDPTLRVVVLRGRGIVRYGALEGLALLGISDPTHLSESAIAERVAAILPSAHVIFAVVDPNSFDPASSRVVQLLTGAGDATWVVPGSPATLPRTRWHAAGPRIAAARELDERIAATGASEAAVEKFLMGNALDDFVTRGTATIGDERLGAIGEPVRSYVAALALLGAETPAADARRLLAEFMCERPLEQLVVGGVTRFDGEVFRFESEAVRRAVAELIPKSSREAVCRVAANVSAGRGHLTRAAALLSDAGDHRQALEILERVDWESDSQLIAALDVVPSNGLAASPRLAAAYARALNRAARYRDARETAAALPPEDAELVLAYAERRTGDYAAALSRLERLERSCEGDLLRAEILSVDRRDCEAAELLRTTVAASPDDQARLAYMRALLGEADSLPADGSDLQRYFTAKLKTYSALDSGDIDAALIAIGEARTAAPSVVDRIDVAMDEVFALFSSGRWAEARSRALEALVSVEETQGDRAAGGLLFLLAYLAADDGQWVHAAQRIARLRHFYGATRDQRHTAELGLLNAHLEFSRGRFDEARQLAMPLADATQDEPIRIAATLIAREADWLSGRPPDSEAALKTSNVEFADRMKMIVARCGRDSATPSGDFNAALFRWEQSGGEPPHATSGSETLKLFRAFLGLSRRRGDDSLLERASRIAAEMKIELATARTAPVIDAGTSVLRSVVVRDYPFAPTDIDGAWRYAARNRLGQWSEIGSLPPLASSALDDIVRTSAKDWMACSERELLYVEGMSSWTTESRDAVGAAFRMRAENHRLRRLIDQDESAPRAQRHALPGIIGESPAIRDVIDRATLIARRDVAVCILGESGTGKELVARAIHAGSPRRHKPFTAVNCGALPENLIESELFGHVRGAFTGADRDRAGLIEATDGGTLFLDEIGEMPLVAQAKLLRFLQEGEFRRIGDTANRAADVRIVTATNRKLDEAVENGRFREDLYYRIAGIEIVLPPLRDRGNDVVALASHFLAAEHDRHRAGPSRFSPDVESVLATYAWPGNVRELQNAVRGAHAVAGDAKEIALEHLPDRLRQLVVSRTPPGSYHDAVARFRRDLIERALAEAKGNQNRAAAMLKISRQALGYQIRELGIMVAKAHAQASM